MKKLVVFMLLCITIRSNSQTLTLSALIVDPHMTRLSNHFNEFVHHVDSAIASAEDSKVDDSVGHLQSHLSDLIGHEDLTSSDKMELASILFFTDTTQMVQILDSINANMQFFTSSYLATSQQFSDSIAAAYVVLNPPNLPEGGWCQDRYDLCRLNKLVVWRSDNANCIQNCQGGTCYAGCEAGIMFTYVLSLRGCRKDYDDCIRA